MNGPGITIEQALEIAAEHFHHARLAEAEALSRQILGAVSEHPEALHLLAMIAYQVGADAAAGDLARRAIAANPAAAGPRNTLGLVLYRADRCEDAVASYRAALRLAPDFATAHFNLGNALRRLGARHEALAAYREALRLEPEAAEAHNNLGALLDDLGDSAGAAAAYRTAIRLNPRDPMSRNNLGHTLIVCGEVEAGMAACRAALELQPHFASAHLNLGNALAFQGRFAEAIAAYRAALACDPTLAKAHSNLGNALKDCGLAGEAPPAYREALRLAPDDAIFHSNLVYALQFHTGSDPEALAAEQARWNARHAAPLRAHRTLHAPDRDPRRRLRVGYVSPDLCAHAVTFFLLPLLEAHDRAQVEVHGYASVQRPDAVTARVRLATEVWHDVLGSSDAEVAEQIRRDRIDLLVDLSMHSAHNRLVAFARQPAPVQVSWLAYPGRSGLETIDWRVTDAHLDPPSDDADAGPERPLRLPDAWCCYDPRDSFPPVGELPAIAAGQVTFGSLNNFSKVSAAALECWARILATVPTSRCAIVCPEGPGRERIHTIFSQHGVESARVDLLHHLSWEDYVRFGARVDLCLDPFPCNGMTTTCHALWMGLPVVSLAGALPVSRAGLSLLSTIGLPELVVRSADEYVRLATDLAHDVARLAALRATLRDRMQSSPLMDAPRFARHMEAAYRTMWQQWCEKTLEAAEPHG